MPKSNTPKLTAATAFVAAPLTAVPKRTVTRTYTLDTAVGNALLAIVSVDGQTASDNQVYAEEKLARAAAGKAMRQLRHVLPDGKMARSRVFTPTGTEGYSWVVWLAPFKARKPRAKKSA